MKKVTATLKSMWNDESAQGATEYILLLVIVVAVVLMFGPKIKDAMSSKIEELKTGMNSVTTSPN